MQHNGKQDGVPQGEEGNNYIQYIQEIEVFASRKNPSRKMKKITKL